MKLLYALLALAFLASPCIAMNETDSAYLEGIQDGYALGYAAIAGQQDPAYEAAYNQGVAVLNGWMDAVGYTGPRWENLAVTRNSYVLPAGSAEKRAAMIGTYPDGSSIGGQYLGGV